MRVTPLHVVACHHSELRGPSDAGCSKGRGALVHHCHLEGVDYSSVLQPVARIRVTVGGTWELSPEIDKCTICTIFGTLIGLTKYSIMACYDEKVFIMFSILMFCVHFWMLHKRTGTTGCTAGLLYTVSHRGPSCSDGFV